MKQAIQWLKQNKGLLQKDIAEKMGISEVAFSNGMKRIQMKWDEDFVVKFHQATGEVFSLDWLLNGGGDKFADKSKPKESQQDIRTIDPSSYINSLIAEHTAYVNHLNDELKKKEIEMRERLAEKDETIASLKRELASLERQLATVTTSDINHYPFPVGVADDGDNRRKNV
jgi:transcriptional regulator with XRE-family HTH domain